MKLLESSSIIQQDIGLPAHDAEEEQEEAALLTQGSSISSSGSSNQYAYKSVIDCSDDTAIIIVHNFCIGHEIHGANNKK